jgi:histidinol-phosphate aminotransferase
MIERLINDRVTKISAYVAGASKEEVARRHGLDVNHVIKLASNENPFGPSARAQEAIKNYAGQVSLYPEDYPRELIKAISDYVGLPETMIIPGGNGADEVMDTVIKLVVSPGGEVIIHTPTFPYYELLVKLYGGNIVKVPMKEDYSFPVDGIIKRASGKTKLIIICSPNNPTGTVIPVSGLRRILGTGPLVMLDEAYVEFAESSLTGLAEEYENLVVLRTFSKAFGLAGLRVGYGAASEEFVEQAMKIKPPHNVNLLAQKAATAALGDLDYLRTTVEKIKALREELFQGLKGLAGTTVVPSQGNFLLITLTDRDTADVILELEKKGIIVRSCKGFGLEDSIRVTVGAREENQAFLENLQDVLG